MGVAMSAETPIEITQVPGHLRANFTGKLAEAATGTADEREGNFLSRALAAFAVHKLSGCPIDDAAKSVVDGGGDGGIDAIYYASGTSILWVVQSKFHRNGRGEPDLGGVTKFKVGLESLLQGRFDVFEGNAAWKAVIPSLHAIFNNGALQVRAVLVYSGINLLSEDRRHIFEDLRARFSADSDYFLVQQCNLTTIHDWITGADAEAGVAEAELKLRNPGWVKTPYETIYGLMPLAELAQLYRTHGRKLIAANMRAYKGDTAVNAEICSSVREEPAHFFYLNNGLTAYCERMEVNNLDRANAAEKRVKVFGLSIVNGAQTLGSIAECFGGQPEPQYEGSVFLKVISLERCEDDRGFAERISRSTNFQNKIGARDFAALDEQQGRIANQLKLTGVTYHYKAGDDTPPPDGSNFTLDEALTACASLVSDKACDYCTRLLANRQSLWSLDEVYPDSELHRSRYARIFRPDQSARTVWRAVQTQRLVVNALKSNESGVRKDFFENCRWLVLHVIFVRLHPEQGENLALSVEEQNEISSATQEYAEKLWTVCESKGIVRAKEGGGWEVARHFRSVFSAASDCQILRNGLLALMVARPTTAPASVPAPIATGNI